MQRNIHFFFHPPPALARCLWRRKALGRCISQFITPLKLRTSSIHHFSSRDTYSTLPPFDAAAPEALIISFTCKPCSKRSTHRISKQGYSRGSILITCPSCQRRHLIADHLKIFGHQPTNIETIMQQKGELVKRGVFGIDGNVELWSDNDMATSNPDDSSGLGTTTRQETGTSETRAVTISKNAMKKLAKEKEKAEKAQKRAQLEGHQNSQAAIDRAIENYGNQYRPDSMPQTIERAQLSILKESTTPVNLRARVENVRAQGAKLAFLLLRQEYGLGNTIQAVVAENKEGYISRQMVKFTQRINPESYVLVSGLVVVPPQPIKSATISGFELHVQKIYIISDAVSQLPVQIEDASRPQVAIEADEFDENGRPHISLKVRLDHPAIGHRTRTHKAIAQIKSETIHLFREFLRIRDFVEIPLPKFLNAASEGGSGVFKVQYFNTAAFLAQSPQLHKQMEICSGTERMFTIGPVFRAEKSNTHRHMTEFTGLDVEMAFEEHYWEVLNLLEELFIFIIKGLKENCKEQVAVCREQYPVEEFRLPEDGKMLRLSFSEGAKILSEAGVKQSEYEDLSTTNEKRLGELIRAKFNTDFYILDKFPMAARPFYTMPCPQNPHLSNSYDFFMRGEEIMSGAQRIHDIELLKQRMSACEPPLNSDGAEFKDYVDHFRFGPPMHGGGGIGLERVVQFFLGLPDIRLATAYPRDPQRLRP
ncbi:MAG: aspartate--tRNA ligase dps1 [Trizodia sp. TS-e1964]|nr:MAG: aspartate--tRNA ligase dps1 [Trizodia sp. TS-e1964]